MILISVKFLILFIVFSPDFVNFFSLCTCLPHWISSNSYSEIFISSTARFCAFELSYRRIIILFWWKDVALTLHVPCSVALLLLLLKFQISPWIYTSSLQMEVTVHPVRSGVFLCISTLYFILLAPSCGGILKLFVFGYNSPGWLTKISLLFSEGDAI